MPRAKQRTHELRTRVLQVALEMLESDGIARFTARRIAHEAGTSMPAVYELFGDKAGVLREIFFEGFRLLRRRLDELDESDDPRADLARVIEVFRGFIREHPRLADLMFSQPFAAFDPGPSELQAGSAVREFIVGRVRRCTGAKLMVGNDIDIAHVTVALAQGLAAQERAGWLGTSKASVDRRWRLATRALLAGFSGC